MSHRTPPGRRAPASQAGRNTYKCDKYRANGQREKNKARKLATMKRRLERARVRRIEIASQEVIRVSAGLLTRLANT